MERIRSLVLERITGLLVDLCGLSPPRGSHRHRLLLNAATRVLATEATLADWKLEDLLPSEVTEQDWAQKLAAALETVPLFVDLDGRPVDLEQIRRELDRHDTLLFLLERDAPDPSPRKTWSRSDGRLVLRLSRDDHDALARIVGSYRVELADGESLVELATREVPREQLETTDRQRREAHEPQPQEAVVPAPPEGPPDTAPAPQEAPLADGLPPSEARLLRALHAELRRAGGGQVELLDDKNLDRIRLGSLNGEVIASCQPRGVTVDRRQPLVERLLLEPEIDPIEVAFLASAVYTAMNHFWQEIEDDHEREFHHALIQQLVDPRSGSADAEA